MRCRRVFLIASLLVVGVTVSGCETFDPTEWFNPKKPLPGERREVFPGGVPGVPEGVPPELMKGYQPPAEPAPQVVEAPPEKPKPKPKAKPKPKPQQAAAPVQRAPAAQRQQPADASGASAPAAQSQPAASPWPSPQQTTTQAAPAQAASPFPDPPRPGSFQR
jgi:hypothetical protein